MNTSLPRQDLLSGHEPCLNEPWVASRRGPGVWYPNNTVQYRTLNGPSLRQTYTKRHEQQDHGKRRPAFVAKNTLLLCELIGFFM